VVVIVLPPDTRNVTAYPSYTPITSKSLIERTEPSKIETERFLVIARSSDDKYNSDGAVYAVLLSTTATLKQSSATDISPVNAVNCERVMFTKTFDTTSAG
jgi:N-acyl-L-homoserine lactone synthetase